jgi:hypothetical protein
MGHSQEGRSTDARRSTVTCRPWNDAIVRHHTDGCLSLMPDDDKPYGHPSWEYPMANECGIWTKSRDLLGNPWSRPGCDDPRTTPRTSLSRGGEALMTLDSANFGWTIFRRFKF